jgi:transposase
MLQPVERDEIARLIWLEMIGAFNPKDLVFVDETGTHTAFTRLYARALGGERAYGEVPKNRGQTQTLIAAISLEGVIADMVIAGGTSGDVFMAFVQEVLVPNLRRGQVVVMDNLAAHKRAEVKDLIVEAGCRLVFLPSYSPDFNPIESLFAWLKQKLRSLAARSVEALLAGIGLVHTLVSGVLVRGWFAGCGYSV